MELATLVDKMLVVPTIAATLGVKEAGDAPMLDTLKTYLRDKHVLPVLDNFEQVVGAAPHVGEVET